MRTQPTCTVAGFVMFVLSLKRGMYMYQFAQYAWTHMIILMVRGHDQNDANGSGSIVGD